MDKFKKSIDVVFRKLTLERPELPKYILHFYADFVELNALFAKEEYTAADVSDLLIDIKESSIIESDLDDKDSVEIASLTSENNDKIEERIQSIFDVCMERSRIYTPEEYPFFVQNNLLKIKSEISEKHKIYIFLLLSANLNYWGKLESVLTKDFELLSLRSLERFLPSTAIIRSFGKNSDFYGNAITKIKDLAVQLGVENNFDKLESISIHNVQERGLDLIGWVPFRDRNPNMIILLCQCACGKNWDTKQNETEFFAEYFRFELPPTHTMFVPYALCNERGKFEQYDRILKKLFFDRKRIIEHIDDSSFFKGYLSYAIVERCLSTVILSN